MPNYNTNRQLPERSRVVFYYPSPKEGESFVQVVLPFYENIDIRETKSARYTEFKLLSRSSNLYGYTGADSRQFELTFTINLPHIIYEHPEALKDQSGPTTRDWADTLRNATVDPLARQSSRLANKFLQKAKTEYPNVLSFHNGNGDASNFRGLSIVGPSPELETQKNLINVKAAELGLYWTNIVRTSVVTNSKNPVLGPPIIRFTHGLLYQDVPCICKKYSISYDEKAGFEMQTLFPRIMKFSLSLEEVRAGDFGKFQRGQVVSRDNLVGYEAMFSEEPSMDPGELL